MDEPERMGLIRGGLISGGGLLVTAFVPLAFPRFATMGAIAGILMLCAGIALTLANFRRRKTAAGIKETKQPPTLRDFFEGDFPLLSLRHEGAATINGQPVPFSFQSHMDYTAGSDFVSIYIPANSASFPAAAHLAPEVRGLRHALITRVPIKVREPAAHSESRNSDMVFTGKVFLYHEDHFTPREIADLVGAYNQQDLQLELRGHTYQTIRWLGSRT